jgi:hypothetical protein
MGTEGIREGRAIKKCEFEMRVGEGSVYAE